MRDSLSVDRLQTPRYEPLVGPFSIRPESLIVLYEMRTLSALLLDQFPELRVLLLLSVDQLATAQVRSQLRDTYQGIPFRYDLLQCPLRIPPIRPQYRLQI